MKKNEIIELNGVEYTLELNRDSFLQIDKICDIKKSIEILKFQRKMSLPKSTIQK